jgi:hypothetical protein
LTNGKRLVILWLLWRWAFRIRPTPDPSERRLTLPTAAARTNRKATMHPILYLLCGIWVGAMLGFFAAAIFQQAE